MTTAAAAAPKAKKAAKPKTPAAHPPYAAMIKAAVKALGDKKGSSRQAILKYICANYKVDAAKAPSRVRISLKKLVDSKALVAAAAAGKKGAGSFKLAAKNQRQRSQQPRRLPRSLLPRNQQLRSLRQLRNQLPRNQRLPRSLLPRNQQPRSQLLRNLQQRSQPRKLPQRKSKC